MEEKLIFDGHVKVRTDGKVFVKNYKGHFIEANFHVFRNKGNEYLSTYYFDQSGVQHHFYPAREIAKAFIDNPENCLYVEQIDGNPYNIKIENLRWMSSEERMEKVRETKDKNSIICEVCGHKYHKNRMECTHCKNEKIKKLNNKIKIKKRYEHVDMSVLPDNYAEILRLRLEGKKHREIAKVLEVSPQRISQILKNIEEGKIPHRTKVDELKQKIAELEQKLAEYETK